MKILAIDMEQRDEVTVYFCWSLNIFRQSVYFYE